MSRAPQNTAQPGPLTARFQAGIAALQAGRLGEARKILAALDLERPNQPEILFQLSRLAHLEGDAKGRARYLKNALAAKPNEPALLTEAAEAFARADLPKDALSAHDRLIAAAPSQIKPKADKALYLQRLGRFDEAEDIFRKLLAKHPREGSLYRMFFATSKLDAGDPALPALRKALNNPAVTGEARIQGHFAMAKALFDQGEGPRAFEELDRANKLQRKAAPYDDAARRAEQLAIRAAQEGVDLTPIGSTPEPRPVFVTGLPRSGTTLAEQIIGAHSEATAGGELAHALRLVWTSFVTEGRMAPLRKASDAQIRDLARAYTMMVRRDTGARSGVVTDKSIQTHLIYGFLSKALPGARFIVIHRDPRDIALSIYRNHFATGTHRYANDLGDIAGVIKDFRASIAYWKGRLGDRIVEFRYEDLVSDPEPQARALVEAAGLDWEDACLRFHESGGAVKTLSVAQVREPIHAGRRAAWTKHEAELAPFIKAWGDDPWD
ncbi:Sulfotransferase family protein [Roseivivax halotolerans]|uniref:Sulfotransferase family protein n=1 Tax=Roseivivax halotolerans TaxID=93684 RepID=A0A1I5UXG6_9RHOB|nr:sulfotransferase [Roseivivax halotolerans]SFP99892.1 Sulfotransferase family protein [Roseivivax halotolerans]